MWRLIIVVATTAIWAASAPAQTQVTGEVVDLVFSVESLVFKVEDLAFKVEDIGGRVEALQVKQTATETRIELPADILFDFDKADIRPTAAPALKQAADLLRQSARGTVRIEGHTDAKGTPSHNQKLSERRSASVQKWLVEREGLHSLKFQIQGFGASRPVAPNSKPGGADDPEGRQKNRRVEIVFGRR